MKPYVYIIQNKDKSHWYVGMRSANECPANEDTGYWGSSTYLDELIEQTGKENWTKTIIKEFDTKHDANEFEQLMISLMWDLPGRVNKNINGYIDMDDPQVKEKHKAASKAGCQKRYEDPVYRENHKAGCKVGARKRFEDPEFRAKHKAASVIANRKRVKPFIATCIKTGEEFYCEKLSCDQVKELKLHQSNVSDCLNGKREQHKGFTFRYV